MALLQTKPKKGQFMNFSRGHSGTKVRYVSSVLVFLRKKHTRIFTQKNGRNSYELFVLALSLVWFAGATPDGVDGRACKTHSAKTFFHATS